MTETKGYTKTNMMRVFRTVEEFRKMNPDMQIQAVATFALVALQPGITIKELRERTGTVQSTCSRNVALLSEGYHNGKAGYGLVEAQPDPYDSRRKVVFLTAKGKRVAETLNAIFE